MQWYLGQKWGACRDKEMGNKVGDISQTKS